MIYICLQLSEKKNILVLIKVFSLNSDWINSFEWMNSLRREASFQCGSFGNSKFSNTVRACDDLSPKWYVYRYQWSLVCRFAVAVLVDVGLCHHCRYLIPEDPGETNIEFNFLWLYLNHQHIEHHFLHILKMDESGIDMGFDLAALTNAEDFDLEYNNDFEQALSLLSTSQDFMYYELKSRAPDTGRYVNARARWHHHDEHLYATLSLSPVERRTVLFFLPSLGLTNIFFILHLFIPDEYLYIQWWVDFIFFFLRKYGIFTIFYRLFFWEVVPKRK